MEKNQLNKKGKRHGYWEIYYPNGSIMTKGEYINGKRNGYWESHYSTSILKAHGNFNENRKEGYWEWFNQNGELIKQIFYV